MAGLMMRDVATIPVGRRGLVAIVDAWFVDYLSTLRWAEKSDYGRIYARCTTTVRGARKNTLMHRLILDAKPGEIVDHINHNTLDNRLCNLRIVDASENQRNRYRNRKGSSRFKGVSYAGGRRAWLAQICHRGRRYRLGRFLTEQEAAAAYDAAARLLHGPMARTNDVGSLP